MELRVLIPLAMFIFGTGCTGKFSSANTNSEIQQGASTTNPSPVPTPAPGPAPAPTPSPAPTPTPNSNFVLGYNEAWFGPYYQNSFTDGYSDTLVTKTLSDIHGAGGDVVRLWLFQNRQGLNLATYAPQTSSIQQQMLTNLERTIGIARQQHLKIYFTLFDGNTMPSDSSEARNYFYNLLNNKYGEGDAFNIYALTPFLELLNNNQDVIYALDLMNEIEAPIQRGYWSSSWSGPRTWIQNTRSFIKTKSPWLKVTSSAGWGWAAFDITNGLFSGLGLDFYDLHVYDDNGNIPSLNSLCSKAASDGVPIILGEFGQSTHSENDQLQQVSTQAFLNNAKNSCFSGALAWRFDSQEAYWSYQRADGSLRPAADVIKNFPQ